MAGCGLLGWLAFGAACFSGVCAGGRLWRLGRGLSGGQHFAGVGQGGGRLGVAAEHAGDFGVARVAFGGLHAAARAFGAALLADDQLLVGAGGHLRQEIGRAHV